MFDIFKIIEAVTTGKLDIKNFSQHEFHPKPDNPSACNWIFLIDTLNFCFWTPGEARKYNVEGNTGYFALCAAINRAIKDGIDVTNPKVYSEFSLDDLENIFRSDDGVTKIPLLMERQQCLQEVGRKLIQKYDGDFKNVVEAAKGSAKKLLEIVVEDFPCFRDEADYKGKRVSIYKRAQILVGDIYACYQGEGLGHFEDINETITMFADYRVPQVLVHFGALIYNDELTRDLKADRKFENGEEMEVEVRFKILHKMIEFNDKVIFLDKRSFDLHCRESKRNYIGKNEIRFSSSSNEAYEFNSNRSFSLGLSTCQCKIARIHPFPQNYINLLLKNQ